MFPVLFAILAGFTHAFEADHLLAVSSIVTKRDSLVLAVKDGVAWGLGHTSTILMVGCLIIVGRVAIAEHTFHYFEATVGLMLIGLGMYRLYKIIKMEQHLRTQPHFHAHPHAGHRLAYGVGLVHGLAGSGSLVLLVMSQIPNQWAAVAYLLVFGLGSVLGMLLASGVFSLPFSRALVHNYALRLGLTCLSSTLCIGFGCKIVFENLTA
jgi:hypothetical protein